MYLTAVDKDGAGQHMLAGLALLLGCAGLVPAACAAALWGRQLACLHPCSVLSPHSAAAVAAAAGATSDPHPVPVVAAVGPAWC
jgi:hypothetical protein